MAHRPAHRVGTLLEAGVQLEMDDLLLLSEVSRLSRHHQMARVVVNYQGSQCVSAELVVVDNPSSPGNMRVGR